jgi:hypothetical protein
MLNYLLNNLYAYWLYKQSMDTNSYSYQNNMAAVSLAKKFSKLESGPNGASGKIDRSVS